MVYGTDTQVDMRLVERVEKEQVGKLCIRRNGNQPKIRRYNIISGFGLDHNLGVFNNGVDAIARALTERYFFCKDGDEFKPTVKPITQAFNKFYFKQFKSRVLDNMAPLPRLSRQQVVDRYTGAKRRVYEEAHLSLQRKGLCEKDAHLNMFVKFEKQDLGKAPRGINPRDPRFNLELGRYIKHAEKPFFNAINDAFGAHTSHTVIKGLNADRSAQVLRSKWDRFTEPVAVGLDATKFDAHVSVQALKFEHSFYTAMFPGNKVLKRLLKWQLNNKGKAYAQDGSVNFSVNGTRSSGDLNTSLGNCLIMCGCVYAYAATRGVEVELANNGDDCVVILERSKLSKFLGGLDGWFRDRGFVMVAEEPVYEFEQIEFCQTHPIQVQTGWRMVRNHVAVLKKDPMCLIAIQNAKTYRKWLYAVGECGATLTAGVPVQQAFYEAFKRNGEKCSERFKEHIFRGSSMATRLSELTRHRSVITPEARVSYYAAYGVPPDHQIAIEKWYESGVIENWTEPEVERCDLGLSPGLKILSQDF